jgi:hypothetical protein
MIGVFSTTTITIAADGHVAALQSHRHDPSTDMSRIARPNLVQPEDPGSKVPENQEGESDGKK